MQTQALPVQTSSEADKAPSPGVLFELPLTENQMAELRETWLQRQINPAHDNEIRGVPYSPLND